jgi:type I restriction enzyme S subunit
MKTYTKYRSSGLDWLGEIPDHWIIKRAKYLFNEVNERSENGEETLLSVSEYSGVGPRTDVIEEGDLLTRADSLEGYKKCIPGDLVMNIMLAWKRGLGVANQNGIVSPAYAVFRLKDSGHYSRYFHYLFRTDLYVAEFHRNSTGIIDSRLRLYPDSFLNIAVVQPPFPEQHAICSYLDSATKKIDTLISKNETVYGKSDQRTGLLQEYRTALILEVVTGRVDVRDYIDERMD